MVRMERRGSGRRQEGDRKQEATAVGDSQTQESGAWGRKKDVGMGDRNWQVVNK